LSIEWYIFTVCMLYVQYGQRYQDHNIFPNLERTKNASQQ